MSEDFACDFADEGTPAFRARKSKNRIVPDLSKCQVFSLANLVEMNDQLSIPEKKPGTFQMPIVAPKGQCLKTQPLKPA